MLYRVLKRTIERKQTGGLNQKLDVFYATGKISEDEYKEPSDMLSK